MDQIFGFFSRIWSAAAAEDNHDLCQQIQPQFQETANWWRQFAAHEVSSVEAVDAWEVLRRGACGREPQLVAQRVARKPATCVSGLPTRHRFDSPKAFSLVIEALLERDDFVASMALLIHWLSEAEQVPLEQGGSSFHQLSQQWLLKLLHRAQDPDAAQGLPQSPAATGAQVLRFSGSECRRILACARFLTPDPGEPGRRPDRRRPLRRRRGFRGSRRRRRTVQRRL